MKTFLLLTSCLVACCIPSVTAGDSKLENVLKQREQLLTEIVQYHQSQYDNGHGSAAQLRDAKLTLARFRRDSTKDIPAKVKHQEEIMALLEEQIAEVDAQVQAGEKQFISLVYAREKLLGAQQKLLEIKTSKQPLEQTKK